MGSGIGSGSLSYSCDYSAPVIDLHAHSNRSDGKDSPSELVRKASAAGIEVLAITEPLQSVSTLLERKPDLIFLDLIMPNTNGYELCTFLRKTTTFQEIPIVILTGRDGMIDRVRAKMSGSSDFMSKPPDQSKVLQILRKFLQNVDAE